MKLLVDGLCVGMLTVMIYQDFKHRQITGLLIPAMLILFFFKSCLDVTFSSVIRSFFINMAFVLSQLVLVFIYFSFRNKKIFNIVDTYLGLGDVLFLLTLSALFAPLNFILFYLIALFITTIIYGMYVFIKGKHGYHIPLAGSMAILLVAGFISQYFFEEFKFSNHAVVENAIQKWMI